MIDRRTVLRGGVGALGTATLAGAAGCLFDGSGDDGGSAERTFLATLPDPTPAVVPSFHATYRYDPARVRDALDGTDAMVDRAGQLVDVIDQIQGTTIDDVDRLGGQRLLQVGHSGSDLGFVAPNGTDLVATGTIDVDGAATLLRSQDRFSDLGDDRGYRRFGGDEDSIDAFAVDGDALTFGSRRITNLGPRDVASAAIDGIEDDSVPAEELSPALAGVVTSLPTTAATVATGFDLVAVRPDTGTAAYDAASASLLAAGIDADVGSETTEIVRVLRYREARRASVDDVQAAVDAATVDGHFHEGDWTVTGSDRSIRIEGSVATATIRDDPASLRRAVPVPAYDDLTAPVDPRDLGRDAPPRVSWEPSRLDDGRIAIVHGGGPTVEDLSVTYTVDGERVQEPWEGPVEEEDRFETAEAADPGSVLDLVWARETVNETILVRIELPDD